MTQAPAGPVERVPAPGGDAPSPDVVAFIRFCHRRRKVTWPELYDEMCAVAARREFKGWDHEQLATRGVTFSLQEMPRMAGWVRATVGAESAATELDAHGGAGTPRAHAQPAGA